MLLNPHRHHPSDHNTNSSSNNHNSYVETATSLAIECRPTRRISDGVRLQTLDERALWRRSYTPPVLVLMNMLCSLPRVLLC